MEIKYYKVDSSSRETCIFEVKRHLTKLKHFEQMQRIKLQVAKQKRMAVSQANKDRLQVPGLAIGTAPNISNAQSNKEGG